MDEKSGMMGDEPSRQTEDETYGYRAEEGSAEELPFHIPRD